MGDLPLSFCENRLARKYSNIDNLSRKTPAKYVDLLRARVAEDIKLILPETFGVIFDGWSNNGEHYVGVFATWTNTSGGVITRLLSCGVQDLSDGEVLLNTFGFSADDIGDYIFDVLSRYDREFQHIEFLCGDNCAVNGLLSDKISAWLSREKNIVRRIPLIGCASHRLNLAVSSLYKQPGSDYYEVVKKVNLLISELRTLKNQYKVNAKFGKSILRANDTRWNSTFTALSRYLEFHPLISSCGFHRDVLKMVPSQEEIFLLNELVAKLEICTEVSIFLQHEDSTI
jgi:hypothetical protein